MLVSTLTHKPHLEIHVMCHAGIETNTQIPLWSISHVPWTVMLVSRLTHKSHLEIHVMLCAMSWNVGINTNTQITHRNTCHVTWTVMLVSSLTHNSHLEIHVMWHELKCWCFYIFTLHSFSYIEMLINNNIWKDFLSYDYVFWRFKTWRLWILYLVNDRFVVKLIIYFSFPLTEGVSAKQKRSNIRAPSLLLTSSSVVWFPALQLIMSLLLKSKRQPYLLYSFCETAVLFYFVTVAA
jgi:hypothetical protein